MNSTDTRYSTICVDYLLMNFTLVSRIQDAIKN